MINKYRMVKQKRLKPCNENQIRNPKSLRCVNKNGKLGKLIIALLGLKSPNNINIASQDKTKLSISPSYISTSKIPINNFTSKKPSLIKIIPSKSKTKSSIQITPSESKSSIQITPSKTKSSIQITPSESKSSIQITPSISSKSLKKTEQLQNLIETLKKEVKTSPILSPIKNKTYKTFKPTLELIKEKISINSSEKKHLAAKIIQRNFKRFITPFINRVSSNIFDRIIYYKKLMSNLNITFSQNKYCIRLYKIDNDNNPIFKIYRTSIVLKNKIGTDTINGVVYLCSILDRHKRLFKFSAKIILNNDKSNQEILILSKLSNSILSNKCPHFPILYTNLKCDRFSDIDTNTYNYKMDDLSHYPRIIRLNPNGSFNTILSELANGNLKMYINDNTIIGNEYQVNALVQILLSIMFFYKEVKSFHNDASSANFLYHKIKPGGYFHYKILERDYYVENIGYLWVIWDFSETITFSDAKLKNVRVNNDFNNIINTFVSHTLNTKINSKTKFAISQLFSIIKYADLTYTQDGMIRLVHAIMNNFKSNGFIKTSISPNHIINRHPYIIKSIDL